MKFELPDDAPEDLRLQQAIPAVLVADAMRNGKDIEVKNAVISGDLILVADAVTGRVSIKKTKFLGSVDWTYSGVGTNQSAIALSHDGTVFVAEASQTRDLIALSPTGEELWRYNHNAAVKTAPIVDGRGTRPKSGIPCS